MVMPNSAVEMIATVDGGTEGGRRPTVVAPPTAADPEISDRPRRRIFTAAEKVRILKEADQAAGTGIGALLRRHGLYSSALSEWRRQRDAGTLGALAPARRGPKSHPTNPLSAELAGARRDIVQLRHRLQRAEAIIEVQKKLADLLGIPLVPIGPDNVPCQTTCPDGRAGRLPAGQRGGCCHLCRSGSVARQPEPHRQTPVFTAGAAGPPA